MFSKIVFKSRAPLKPTSFLTAVILLVPQFCPSRLPCSMDCIMDILEQVCVSWVCEFAKFTDI